MERLNYFNPYKSKGSHHEDQLTRAYLVLLKHSFHSFAVFVEYCKTKHVLLQSEESYSLNKFIETGWDIQTQKGNPVIDTDWLLSILITDTELKDNSSSIEASDRNARYDGIITFGKNTTFIIENKPRSGNVWLGQLNPSVENLSEETKVYSAPVVLEWKEIIKQLNHLLSITTLSGYEKMMTEDFLAYIDEVFPFLNPFDNLSLCKGNHELIYRRINNILKAIVLDEDTIQFHRGWGYHIKVAFPQIREIGLILKTDGDEWSLELSLYFGATQNQAKALYSKQINTDLIADTEWDVFPNFHVAYQSSNLVWFECCDTEKYINFWSENVSEIYQNKKAEVQQYLDWLYTEGIIIKAASTDDALQNKFFNTAMPNLNICPELGFTYSFTSSVAEKMDKEGKMENFIKEKIIECLKVVSIDSTAILKV